MLVLERHRDDATVTEVGGRLTRQPIHAADRLAVRLYGNRMPGHIWSPGLFGINGLEQHPLIQGSDIISLYWVNGGFLSISGIRRLLHLGKPVVWRLSDTWPMTGGCHHPGDCDRFEKACGRCPQLGSNSEQDLSSRQWRQKRRWPTERLTVVSPSRWLAGLASASSLFRDARLEHITTGVDLDVFKPCPKDKARRQLGLPNDRCLVLSGANNAVGNTRKGFSQLIDALRMLAARNSIPHVDLVLFGSDTVPELPFDLPVHVTGMVDDEAKIAQLYGAADLFVMPSLEENLPNTVIEAMASALPVVAFDVGGTGELIEHGVTGYLAKAGDSSDLAKGIEMILEETMTGDVMGRRGRDAIAANHDQRMIAVHYWDLYQSLYADQP